MNGFFIKFVGLAEKRIYYGYGYETASGGKGIRKELAG